MITLKDVIKYFKSKHTPLIEKILMAILLISIPSTIILTPIYIAKEYKKQPAITGGLELPPKPETITKIDSLFNDTDYAGDTACFELINNHKILLRCVCPCNEYKMRLEKQKGAGD